MFKNILPNEKPNDKAQLVLVAGLIVAVTFVGLVIILNSVLLAQNIDSRGISPEIDSSERGVESIKTMYGEGINRANADRDTTNNVDTEWVETANTVAESHGTISRQERGEIEVKNDVTNSDVQTGQYMTNDNPETAFTSSNSQTNWILTTGTNEYRQGDFRFDVDTLPTSSGAAVEIVVHNEDTDEAQLIRVYQQGGNAIVEEQTAEVNSTVGFTETIEEGEPFEDTDPTERVYQNDDEILKIDVTQGTIQDSDVFNFGGEYDGSSDYGIAIQNGGNADGVFRLTTGDNNAPRTQNFEQNPDDDEPYVIDGIYSFDMTYTYLSDDYEYTNTVTVKPDSIDASSSTNSPIYDIEPANQDQTFEFVTVGEDDAQIVNGGG